MISLDFSQEFPKFDVMTELGLDPLDLGNLDILRPKLRQMLNEENYATGLLETMNDK